MQDIVFQLHRFITALDKYHKDCNQTMEEANIFPIEVELDFPTFQQRQYDDDDDDDDDEVTDQNDQVNNSDNQQQKAVDVNLLDIAE